MCPSEVLRSKSIRFQQYWDVSQSLWAQLPCNGLRQPLVSICNHNLAQKATYLMFSTHRIIWKFCVGVQYGSFTVMESQTSRIWCKYSRYMPKWALSAFRSAKLILCTSKTSDKIRTNMVCSSKLSRIPNHPVPIPNWAMSTKRDKNSGRQWLFSWL